MAVTTGPKPMALVGERPLVWHVMRYYAHFGHTDFVLCLGYGASAVKDFFLNYDETRSNDFVLERGTHEPKLFRTDISDWQITLVDTGLNSQIGERLRRVRRFVEDEPMFMANYADVLTDAPLPDMIDRFDKSNAVASLLAVPPQSSHHAVDIADDGMITGVTPMRDLRHWENGGYFLFRPEIFDELHEDEDLVEDAIVRLVRRGRVMAYPYKGYWSPADTVKERAQLDERYHRADCPWMIWDPERSGLPARELRRLRRRSPNPRRFSSIPAIEDLTCPCSPCTSMRRRTDRWRSWRSAHTPMTSRSGQVEPAHPGREPPRIACSLRRPHRDRRTSRRGATRRGRLHSRGRPHHRPPSVARRSPSRSLGSGEGHSRGRGPHVDAGPHSGAIVP